MPHKCARCGKIYDNRASELMKGCTCGARVFLFIKHKPDTSKAETLKKLNEQELDDSDLEWLDDKFREELEKSDKTVRLDVENLLRLGEGKYRLNVASLMKGDPLVVKVKKGVYYIDIPYSMKKKRK